MSSKGKVKMKPFCENQACDFPGYIVVSISERKYSDSNRTFCYSCFEAYTFGVQHGKRCAAARKP